MLPRKLVEKILNWEYVDFNEFPPARGNTHHPPVVLPNVLIIHSAEAMGTQRKLIPDLTTWSQCFSIYASVLAMKYSQYILETGLLPGYHQGELAVQMATGNL